VVGHFENKTLNTWISKCVDPTLWGRTHEERWGALDGATQKLNEQLGKIALMTGAQLALRHIDESQKQQSPIPAAKCPFTPPARNDYQTLGRGRSGQTSAGNTFLNFIPFQPVLK
jgi:hypothetical protein